MRIYKKLKLGIVGHGFVGKATDWGFNKRVSKFIVDPLLNSCVSDLKDFEPEIVFICVPTPMGNDGSQDSSIIEEVVKELILYCPNAIKVVKSTVLPTLLDKLHKLDSKLIYNPEFLREKHANLDFANSEMIIFGGDRNISSQVSNAYLKHSRCKTKEHIFTDLMTASLIKYSINTFLASKVIFFNELHSIYEKLDVKDSWESIINIISRDSRIGDSHMNVPGHDGRKGFGGACFPKDSLALVTFGKNLGIDLNLLITTVKINNKIRSQYKELDSRESEQNVTFNDKI
jgi:nucleotide sugar dehydrogenase